MGHQCLFDHQFGILSQLCGGNPVRGIDAFDLNGFHFHITAFVNSDDSGGIHDIFPLTVAFSIMLFHISHFCIFSHMKRMNTVMFRFFFSAVMYSASGDYRDIRIFSDKKIIIH